MAKAGIKPAQTALVKPVPHETLQTQLFASLRKNREFQRKIDEWSPRASSELDHLPNCGDPTTLPEGSPERAVAELMGNWSNGRFGPIADALLYFTDTPKGKKAGLAKQDFGERRPKSFRIVDVEDQAASAARVLVSAEFDGSAGPVEIELGVTAIYQGEDNDPLVRGDPKGSWRIVQNSFSSVLYGADL